MFYGSYNHNLDEKGRLMLPKKFRDYLNDYVYILKGYDGALSIYPEEEFAKYVENIKSLPTLYKKDARDLERIALSSTYELPIDKVGRVVIPSALLSKYQISKEVIVIGLIDHFEVWDLKKWNEYVDSNEEMFESKAESLFKNE